MVDVWNSYDYLISTYIRIMLGYMDPLTNNFHILDKENEALHLFEHAKVVLFSFVS